MIAEAGPRDRKTTRDGSFYYWKSDPPYPSVTTALRALAKPALVYWAARSVAEFMLDQPDKWQGLTRAEALDLCKRAPWRESEQAADVGTAVHRTIEAMLSDYGVPRDWPEALAPFGEAFYRFCDDRDPTFLFTEMSVYHRAPAGREDWRYAGTFDFIATVDDKRTLVDVKTGKGVYPDTALQLVAYARAEFAGLPDGTEMPLADLGPIEAAAVLHLRPQKYEWIPFDIGDRTWRWWLACRALWQFTQESSALMGRPQKAFASANVRAEPSLDNKLDALLFVDESVVVHIPENPPSADETPADGAPSATGSSDVRTAGGMEGDGRAALSVAVPLPTSKELTDAAAGYGLHAEPGSVVDGVSDAPTSTSVRAATRPSAIRRGIRGAADVTGGGDDSARSSSPPIFPFLIPSIELAAAYVGGCQEGSGVFVHGFSEAANADVVRQRIRNAIALAGWPGETVLLEYEKRQDRDVFNRFGGKPHLRGTRAPEVKAFAHWLAALIERRAGK